MKVIHALALVAGISIVGMCPPLAAQSSSDEPGWAPVFRPEMHIERAEGNIRIDGYLDDDGWTGAAYIDQFSEIEPGENIRPPVFTEAWITYDDENLYVAFKAHDDPRQIRASLRNRDEIFQDDWVGIILDPYGDATRAYELFANPLGIQGDLLMSRSGENVGFDMIYHTAGRITERGYIVEMAIPFKSIRFPNREVHDWRITLLRNYPRTSRHIFSWASVDRNDSCLMCQLGTISGLSGISGGGTLEVLPSLVGAQQSVGGATPGSLDHGRITVEPSLNVRYNLSSSLTAEATLNPDFSQVESDAAQIDVNTTFALFFPERRPFFQEGAEMFDTMVDVVYTRSINSPSAAVKLTGQPGRMSIGFISAIDERTPILLPFRERSDLLEAGRSVSNIFRARQSFGANSYVGGVISDRRYMIGGSGSEVGIDGQWQATEHIRIDGQFVLSHTDEPDAEDRFTSTREFGDDYTAALDGESFSGYATFLRAGRYGRNWNWSTTYQAFSPTFRAANGFVARNDFRRLSTNPSMAFYSNGFVDFIRPSLLVARRWAFDGTELQREHQASVFLRMKGQTNMFASARYGSEHYLGHDLDGLYWLLLDAGSQFSEVLSAGFFVGGGRSIARFANPPAVGNGREAALSVSIKPLQRLFIRPRVSYASLTNPDTGEEYYSGFILRNRLDLLFTPELSLRLITEYNDFASAFSVEPLLAYRLNAYSMMYVGTTQRMIDGGFEHGFYTTSRQFFFKMQYLFRT
jgi:hypothetical protein